MTSFDPWIKPPPFFMPSVHFIMGQMHGLKITDHQLFFPEAHGTEFNCCSLLWIGVLIIYQTKDTFQEFRTMEQDVY